MGRGSSDMHATFSVVDAEAHLLAVNTSKCTAPSMASPLSAGFCLLSHPMNYGDIPGGHQYLPTSAV